MIYPLAKVLPSTVIDAEDNDWFIGDFAIITIPFLKIGHGSQINAHSSITGTERVEIGRDSVISYHCCLLSSSDSPNPPHWKHSDYSPEEKRRILSAPIRIGSDCFVGAFSLLMPGCIVPDNTVIRAYSYCYMKDGELKCRPSH